MLIIPLSIVWILTGIWHGTGMAYVVWGVYWGLLIILSAVLEPEIKSLTKFLRINTETQSWKVFQMIRTFFLFCIGRLITIPNDLHATVSIFKEILTDFQVWQLADGSLYELGLDRANFNLVILCILLLWGVSLKQENGKVREQIADWNIVFRWGIIYIGIAAVLIFGIYGPGYNAGAFVYMNF